METIRRIWNWCPPPERMRTVRARALRALAWFLLLMLCCTLLSRAADAVTVPVVTAEKPKRMALTRKFSLDGVFEAVGGIPVLTASGLTVLQLAVAEGDRVEKGDLLFTCDTAEIEKEIARVQLEIAATRTELNALERESAYNAQKAEEEQALALERAEEDYEAAVRNAELAVQEAQAALNDAQRALRLYRDTGDGYYDEADSQAEYNQLRSAYRAASLAYEKALTEQEDALQKAQRDVDDRSVVAQQAPDSSRELKSISLQQQLMELASLQESIATQGAVYSPADGIVMELGAKVGGRTTAEAAALIMNGEALRFTATLTEKQSKLVQPGDFFNLRLSGEDEAVKDQIVRSVGRDTTGSNAYILTAEPAGVAAPGQSASGEFTYRSSVYNSVIPLAALYGADNDYYVLAAEATETSLGTEFVATRYAVTLLERSEESAAVSGISNNVLLISASDKPVRAGDRIRLS